MLYDFNFKKFHIKWVVVSFIIINLVSAGVTQFNRTNTCSADNFYEFEQQHDSNIFYGVFQPYLDYKGIYDKGGYEYELSMDCSETEDYLNAEDHRDWMLMYLPYKYCLEEYER